MNIEQLTNKKSKFFSYAYNLTKNREDAEDLLQEAYLKAWKGRDTFLEGSNLDAWFRKVIRNKYIDGTRIKQLKRVASSDEEIQNYFLEINKKDFNYGFQNLVFNDTRKQLNCLNGKAKTYLNLRLQGYKFKEIAEMHGEKLETVKSCVFRGLRILRTKIKRA